MSENKDFNENMRREQAAEHFEEHVHHRTVEEEPIDAYGAVIQKNAGYYKNAFRTMDENNQSASWNWSAFLFPGYWSFYRKMYLLGIVIFAVRLLSILPTHHYVDGSYSVTFSVGVFDLILNILCGFFGNYLYKRKVDGIVSSASGMEWLDKIRYMRSRGGVNGASCIAPAIINIVLIVHFFRAVFSGQPIQL